ncbi:FhaA domain-containing protein [Streptomyces sp. NPDC102467]|uniref:FhaA domain-containing protein n=1 Tax=Streptomyces sp. NPDC102467 TaxID=3366179 RepID=UPI003830890D
MKLVDTAEQTMERWTNALWTLLLPPRQKQGEVVSILCRQCDEQALILDRERVLVPNAFVVEVPPPVHHQLTADGADVGRHLAVPVRRHAAERGYSFAGPVAVHLQPSASSTIGRFRVHSRIAPLASPRHAE